jgi:hypothetical protein
LFYFLIYILPSNFLQVLRLQSDIFELEEKMRSMKQSEDSKAILLAEAQKSNLALAEELEQLRKLNCDLESCNKEISEQARAADEHGKAELALLQVSLCVSRHCSFRH